MAAFPVPLVNVSVHTLEDAGLEVAAFVPPPPAEAEPATGTSTAGAGAAAAASATRIARRFITARFRSVGYIPAGSRRDAHGAPTRMKPARPRPPPRSARRLARIVGSAPRSASRRSPFRG